MADTNPSLHIDTDWKKQAQEEKRKLAEAEKQKAAAPAVPSGSPASTTGSAAGSAEAGGATRGATRQRDLPVASFATIVQSMVTQALYYLGDLSPRGGEPTVNLDLAKHQIDMLGVLEQKTSSNLTADEQKLLDAALYEARMRYVSVASQYIS